METTFESSSESVLQSVRNKIALIEFIELPAIGFALWCFFVLASPNTPTSSPLDLIIFFAVTEGIFLGSWALYNIYIRIARAGGRIVDVALWVLASFLTSTYTFWAWSIAVVVDSACSRVQPMRISPTERRSAVVFMAADSNAVRRAGSRWT